MSEEECSLKRYALNNTDEWDDERFENGDALDVDEIEEVDDE